MSQPVRQTIFLTVFMQILSVAHSCQTSYSREPLDGIKCVSENQIYQNLTNTQWHICVIYCMQRSCAFINYNRPKRYCLVSDDSCAITEPAEDFTMAVFGPQWECLKWVNHTGADVPQDAVQFYDHLHDFILWPARVRDNRNILPGKTTVHTDWSWACLEGQWYDRSQDKEVLTVAPNCMVTWQSFTAGDPLPAGAVVGGQLADGEPLYIIASTSIGSVGSYNPQTEDACVEFDGAHSVANMAILVLH